MPFLPQSTLQMKYERWFFETLSCTKGRGKTSERGAFIRFLGLLEENFETISVFLRFGVSVTDDLLMLYLIVLLFFRWKIMSKSSRFQIFQFFSRFQIPSHIIYIYLNIKYLYSIKKGICPSFFNWKNWKWKEYSAQVSIPSLMIYSYLKNYDADIVLCSRLSLRVSVVLKGTPYLAFILYYISILLWLLYSYKSFKNGFQVGWWLLFLTETEIWDRKGGAENKDNPITT